jgi:hypothetical protein
MEIGPVQNNQPIQQPSPNRKPQETVEAAKEAATDRVEISEDARRLLAETADRALREEAESGEADVPDAGEEPTAAEARPSGEDRPEDKLAEIRRRIEAGFYDRPEIKNKIADKLSDDLDL